MHKSIERSSRVKRRHRPAKIAWTMAFAALAVLGGCTGSDQTPLTEEQNYFVEASRALKEGDEKRAMEMLTASIESKPSRYAHYERAKLWEKQGDDEKAVADCDAALVLQPGDADVAWLLAEIRKEKSKRFKGRFATPPSARK